MQPNMQSKKFWAKKFVANRSRALYKIAQNTSASTASEAFGLQNRIANAMGLLEKCGTPICGDGHLTLELLDDLALSPTSGRVLGPEKDRRCDGKLWWQGLRSA